MSISSPPEDVSTTSTGTEGQEVATGAGQISIGKRLTDKKTLLSFVIAIGIVFFVWRWMQLNPGQVLSYIRTVNPVLFLLGFLAYYVAFPVRTFRWRALLHNAGVHREESVTMPSVPGLMEIIFLSWFANCIVPGKLGDAYRGFLMKKSSSASFFQTIGTVLAERILDMVVLFAMLVVAAVFGFRGREAASMEWLLIFGLALVLAVVAGLLAMNFLRTHIVKLVPERFRATYLRFEQGTLHSLAPRTIPLVLVLTVAVWMLESSRLFLVISAFGIPMSPAIAIFIALAASLLTTLPITPGGLGAVEGAMTTAFALVGLNKDLAGAVAVVDRSISYWSILLIGGIVWVLREK